jgi:serine/threonine protein kinase
MQDLSKALNFLHFNCHLVHGDVRPCNVHFGEGGVAKLGGLFCSTKVRDFALSWAEYSSPEVLRQCVAEQGVEFTCASDVWTLGITLFESLHGIPPFTGNGFALVYERISKDVPLYNSKAMEDLGLIECLDKILNKDPAKRPVGEALMACAERL